ncbi:MAG: nuclear transport factor 2 family protein, partial [Bacteroidota bacterium]
MLPKEVVQKWIDAFNKKDSDALAALYSEEAVNHQVMNEPLVG